MSTESHYLLIGLQDSGKTTFLAALWYLVQPHTHPTALVLDYLDGNSKYLNLIRKDWLEYKRVPRTHSTSERVVSMRLKDQKTGSKMTLHFPDLAGETFEHQWTSRQWTREYQNLLTDSAGGLLFVNPDAIKGGIRIDQANDIIAGIEMVSEAGLNEEQPSGDIPPWDKKQSPTQVQLVEILQFIRDSGVISKPFRLAVVVSAWDRVRTAEGPPPIWVKRRLPLLSQFLQANPGTFECEFFGVSAQGGVYVAPLREPQSTQQVDEPLSRIDQAKRIKVVGDCVVDENDITLPLKWMMR